MSVYGKVVVPALVISLVVLGTPGSARGQSPMQQLASLQLATALGDLLASEDFCKLKYDQAAIQQFIRTQVKEDDIGFTSNLNGMVVLGKYNHEQMSPSAKTAHCAQIERVARSYGFIK